MSRDISVNKRRVQAWRRGLTGERLASVLLFLKGYRILERRFKTPLGEIDLIAARGRWLVFIEVKVRDTLPQALESISKKNRQRVLNAARWYLARHPHDHAPFLRFDVIVLSPPFSIRHIQNAWGENF